MRTGAAGDFEDSARPNAALAQKNPKGLGFDRDLIGRCLHYCLVDVRVIVNTAHAATRICFVLSLNVKPDDSASSSDAIQLVKQN